MTMPGFTAEESIRSQRSSYRRGVQMMEENVVVPSLLSATQCQWANANCGDDPKSPACKMLKGCVGAVAPGLTRPQPVGVSAFNDYIRCALGCQALADNVADPNARSQCVDILC
jgi:hypothetical protein